MSDIGRNDPCHCGSGKKYKKCHLEKDEKKGSQVRAKAALNAAKVAAKEAKKSEAKAKAAHGSNAGQSGGWLNKISKKVPFFQKKGLPSTKNK